MSMLLLQMPAINVNLCATCKRKLFLSFTLSSHTRTQSHFLGIFLDVRIVVLVRLLARWFPSATFPFNDVVRGFRISEHFCQILQATLFIEITFVIRPKIRSKSYTNHFCLLKFMPLLFLLLVLVFSCCFFLTNQVTKSIFTNERQRPKTKTHASHCSVFT